MVLLLVVGCFIVIALGFFYLPNLIPEMKEFEMMLSTDLERKATPFAVKQCRMSEADYTPRRKQAMKEKKKKVVELRTLMVEDHMALVEKRERVKSHERAKSEEFKAEVATLQLPHLVR